ncbi:hypothetical protein PILCRDRAFT_88637 [Piloderma croceum F 1598]|uniref:DUF6818 domain-containing protein n=1 Tax=Piloderma croceum (strain F 1598) TaxID=765440 RepID=A0A0C3FDZ6_PILCF|nr:hypothetical protein PILCRDRAFT_88637 [Piloderma croceum F 1598]
MHLLTRLLAVGARLLLTLKARGKLSKDHEVKKPRGGRTLGVANYLSKDVDGLFKIIKKVLPIGGKGWGNVEDEFLSRAAVNGQPARTAKSLETKFKQLVKVSKPMGDAECPLQVERAHQIDWLLNEKAGTQDLDDSEIVDANEEESDGDSDDGDNDDGDKPISISSDGEEDILKKASRKKSVTVKSETHAPSLGPIARRTVSNRLDTPFTQNTRTPRNAPTNLLNSISSFMMHKLHQMTLGTAYFKQTVIAVTPSNVQIMWYSNWR